MGVHRSRRFRRTHTNSSLRIELAKLNAEIHSICTEYVRQAEELEINRTLFPICIRRMTKGRRCAVWHSDSFTGMGTLFSILLAATMADWSIAGAAAATAAFLMLQIRRETGMLAAVPERTFVRWFHVLHWPRLAVLSGSIGLTDRRGAASALARCGAEIALLFLAAYASVGAAGSGGAAPPFTECTFLNGTS